MPTEEDEESVRIMMEDGREAQHRGGMRKGYEDVKNGNGDADKGKAGNGDDTRPDSAISQALPSPVSSLDMSDFFKHLEAQVLSSCIYEACWSQGAADSRLPEVKRENQPHLKTYGKEDGSAKVPEKLSSTAGIEEGIASPRAKETEEEEAAEKEKPRGPQEPEEHLKQQESSAHSSKCHCGCPLLAEKRKGS